MGEPPTHRIQMTERRRPHDWQHRQLGLTLRRGTVRQSYKLVVTSAPELKIGLKRVRPRQPERIFPETYQMLPTDKLFQSVGLLLVDVFPRLCVRAVMEEGLPTRQGPDP
jgi:hypothetical protein